MNLKGKIILVISLIVLSILSYNLSSSKTSPDIQLPRPTYKFRLYKDVAYKQVSSKQDSLKLDIYQPSKIKAEKLPVVIYLHGGAWTQGSKEMILNNFREYILAELLDSNYIVISINYTLLGKGIDLEKPLKDMKDVMSWISKNAEKYQLDINNVGLWGGSAGGHLALMNTYRNNGELLIPVKYVVDFFAPTDLRKLYRTDANYFLLRYLRYYDKENYQLRKKKIMELTGFDIDKNRKKAEEKCIEFSPIKYVNKKTVPTLIFHGTDDNVVALSQSQLLAESLKKYGISHHLHQVERANHSFSNIDINEAQNIAKKTVEFIKSNTK